MALGTFYGRRKTRGGGWLPASQVSAHGNVLNPFTPYVAPTSAPIGTYDPSLDFQGENSNVGYGYAAQDYGTNSQRGQEDYGYNQGQMDTQHARSLSDLLQQHGYNQADFETQRGGIRRNYTNLADQQGGALEATGQAQGGALAQALAKRTENQGRDIGAVDTQANREQTGYDTNVGRTNEDYGTQSGRLSVLAGRGQDDLNSGFLRAGAEHTRFGQQLNRAAVMQSAANGGLPERPSNEYTAANGQVFRKIVHGNTVYHQHPNGRLVPIRKVRR